MSIHLRVSAFLFALLISPLGHALDQQEFQLCIAKLRQQATQEGLPAQVISQYLDDVSLNEKVMELDSSQPEFTSSFADYYQRRLSDTRIKSGRQHYRQQKDFLDSLTRQYGVPGRYLVAFWGLETNYGGYTGNVPTLDALATLTCEGRRGDYFQGELFNALRILQQGHIDLDNFRGSWAGAMGQVQFMPSVFLQHAVDHDGDGQRDIWNNTDDALASAAHFLKALGWQSGERWGREVSLPANFDYSLTGFTNQRDLSQWAKLGVRLPNGGALPTIDMRAALLTPSGHRGPAFLAYPNFRVVMGWNRSHSYALTVGRLADRIAGDGPLHRAPRQAPRLKKEQVEALQATLNRQGHNAGDVDGLMGPGTRAAIARYQKKNGMVADGFPSRKVLKALSILP